MQSNVEAGSIRAGSELKKEKKNLTFVCVFVQDKYLSQNSTKYVQLFKQCHLYIIFKLWKYCS